MIFQFAKGDMTVPNPTTTAILRAGDLAGPGDVLPQRHRRAGRDRSCTRTRTRSYNVAAGACPRSRRRPQIATFFASDGATTIDPDGPGPVFETPIAGPLPEGTNF